MSNHPRRTRLIALLTVLFVISLSLNIYYVARHHAPAGSGSAESAKATTYVCPMHPTIVQDHPGDCPICGMKLVPKESLRSNTDKTTKAESAVPAPATEPAAPESTTVAQTKTVYTCPMDPQVVEDHPGKCPICGMNLVKETKTVQVKQPVERRIAYYRSPMDPKITSPVPRKDDMGMDYVPVYEDELNTVATAIHDRAEVTIDPERQQLIGLRTARATRGDISGGWKTPARVETDPTQIAQVNVKVEGYVEKVYADFVGKPVRRGEPLFTFYSPQLYAAQQEYLLALKSRQTLGATGSKQDEDALVSAVEQKLKLADVSDAEIKRLEETGQTQKNLTIVSPVSGVITVKNIVEGSSLMPGTITYEITDLGTVWVMADAYEGDLSRVHVGMPATLTLAAFPNREFKGKVAFVDPVLDPQSRTAKVRINFPNPKGELKPDMFGEVTLEGAERNTLVIPADAVIPSGTRSMVFVAMDEGRFVPREVKLGAKSGDTVEVLSGLKEGEAVVTRANFLIDSESSLRAALSAMQGS